MINEENLHNLYDGIIKGDELTTQKLMGYGFKKDDLTALVKKQNLERIKRGFYSFKSANDLYSYGQNLFNNGEYSLSKKCFEKCLELGEENPQIYFYLLATNLKGKNYKVSFKYLDNLLNLNNRRYIIDVNFYLLMLNKITHLPEKYKNYVNKLSLTDIIILEGDKRYHDIFNENQMRTTVWENNLKYAIKQFYETHTNVTLEDNITKMLLHRALSKLGQKEDTYFKLVQDKKYEEIVIYLEEKRQKHMASLEDYYNLKLAKAIIELRHKGTIPLVKASETNNIYKAIDDNNYELAFIINAIENTITKALTGIDYSTSVKSLLLSDIHENIKEISHKEIISENDKEETYNSFANYFKGYLRSGDFAKALQLLNSYLISINKEDYEFLIVDLIKICLIRRDNNFSNPMSVINCLEKNIFKWNILYYVQKFQTSLKKNRFDSASIFLDIISKAKQFGQEYPLLEDSYHLLNETKASVPNIEYNPDLERLEQVLKRNNDIANGIPVEMPVPKKSRFISDEEMININHQMLVKNHEIIVLNPMKKDRIQKIHKIVSRYPDMMCFDIDSGNAKRVVLQYKSPIKDLEDYKSLANLAKIAFEEQRYDDCIKLYLVSSQESKHKKYYIYANLGQAYLKKGDYDKAISCFTVAAGLDQRHNNKFNYEALINHLKTIKSNKKSKYFEEDVLNFYGVQNLNGLTNYILESNLDVETACHELGISEEEKNIITLMYVQKFYAQKNYEKGDQFLKAVEKSDDKTQRVLTLLNNVKSRRKFYANREDNTNFLSLNLKLKLSQKENK